MSGICLESTSRGIITAKVILMLSLILPYVVDWLNEPEFYQLAVYAPTWVYLSRDSYTAFGPSFFGFIMIFQWFPYMYVGYQSYMFAQGQYTSVRRYVGGVVFVTIIAIILSLPMMMSPRASTVDMDYFSIVIPLPFVSILALILIPLLRPVELKSAWDGGAHDVFPQHEDTDSSEEVRK